MAKQKKIDGLGPKEIALIVSALRGVFRYSAQVRIVQKRCLLKSGFSKCEKCQSKCPKVFVDHIQAIGFYSPGFVERLFVSSQFLQGLCAACHKIKTKVDNAKTRAHKKRIAEMVSGTVKLARKKAPW